MNKKLTKRNNLLVSGLLALVMGSFSSCEKSEFNYNETKVTKPNLSFMALTSSSSTTPGALIQYNAGNVAQAAVAAYTIPGLQANESIVAIDYRPSTKVLYGISSTGRLYTFAYTRNASTNAITGLSTTFVGTVTPAISGAVSAFDFNPVADRIRIVTASGQNLRVNPADATAIVDGNISGVANAVVAGAAYTNSTNPAPTTTELYDLDVASQKLYKQDANSGALTEVGMTGLLPLPVINTSTPGGYSTAYNNNITSARNGAAGGFDISASGVGLAVFAPNAVPAIPAGGISPAVAATATTPAKVANPVANVSAVSNPSTLFMINLQTGKATDLGVISIISASNESSAANIIGIAILP